VRVLVVDDSPAVRARLTALLSEIDGVEIAGEAEHGDAAIDKARTLRPDVVLLDLQMSPRGGLDALAALKTERGAPTVMVLTNHATDAYRSRCLALGADHFFDKATDMDRMVAVLIERAARAG
jgi:two-component system, OmpR family, response regulator